MNGNAGIETHAIDGGAETQMPPASPGVAAEAEVCHWWCHSDQAHVEGM
jgi:hypothetical protein